MIRFIVACDRRLGMAKHGCMPWSIPDDEHYFTAKTHEFGGQVLMGRRTFDEALLEQPLKDRTNFVVQHTDAPIDGATVVTNLDEFMQSWQGDLWIIGGGNIFAQTLKYADELYITRIDADFDCDVFFPEYENQFALAEQSEPKEQNGFHYRYEIWRKK